MTKSMKNLKNEKCLLAGLASASVLCAVLYLLAAIAGAVLSAVSVTARNPLELLQVRE